MSVKTIEQRSIRSLVETRAGSAGQMRIGGYALKWGTRSQNLGGFIETVERGFANKSAGDGWPGVLARYNHDDNRLLGTTDAGTLALAIDDVGLDYTVTMPETRRDVYELVDRGDVRSSSFAFIVFEEDWSLDENGFPLRSLITGRITDVAPVNSPAYLDTSSGLRSLAEMRSMPLEDVARLAGEGKLATLLTPAPTVVDLGASKRDDTTSDGKEEQATATPSGRVQVLLRELEMKKKI